MTKQTKHSSQYFQADFSLLQSVASKGNFKLLAAMLILNRFANGKPKTPTEQPFSITYAGAKAISEHLHCRWESGKQLQSELMLNGYISKIRQAKGSLYKINHQTLNINLPFSFVDNVNGANSIIDRINHAENYSDSDKLDCLMFLLNCYKSLSMSDLGGIYGIFQNWETGLDFFDNAPAIAKLTAENTQSPQAYIGFIENCLNIQQPSDAQFARFWAVLNLLKQLGLIYEVVVLLSTPVQNQAHQLIFTLRINDYHANSRDFSYTNTAMDSNIAYYGNKAFNYDADELTFDEMNLNTSEQGEKVIRLVLPRPTPTERYHIMSLYRPRFRFSHPDIALWQKNEEQNINQFLDIVDEHF